MDRSVKLLLTLLALLTGLSAAPAQARPCAGSGIEQVQPPGGGSAQPIAALALSGRAAAQPSRAKPELGPSQPQQCVVTPLVRRGDRALE